MGNNTSVTQGQFLPPQVNLEKKIVVSNCVLKKDLTQLLVIVQTTTELSTKANWVYVTRKNFQVSW